MDIWMSYCTRKARCAFCNEEINPGQPMVRGKSWKKTASNSKWCVSKYWHPSCWVEQGLVYLSKQPYIPRIGRKSMDISVEVKEKRNIIMRRRGSAIQRLKREMKKPVEQRSSSTVSKIVALLEKYKKEIEPLGGIPPKWLEPI